MTEPIRPHPKNVDGPFYVEYGCCTACDVPMQEAPNHFAYDADNHCYVCRQPQTAAETTDMIGMAWITEFQCIRYRGNDPNVLRRFAELDLRDICDVEPPRHIAPIIRNHVKFTIANPPTVATPQQLADEFIKHLNSQSNEWRQFKTTPIHTPADSASLEFSWYDDHFHPIVFDAVPGAPGVWHIYYPLTNDLGDHGVGNVISFWLSRNPGRFTEIRWYSDTDWQGAKIGQSTRI
ncbi:MAG: ferredoxin [Planctomycetes bacterium]|nr:ferredoxin [Planctomycetota bacterium]